MEIGIRSLSIGRPFIENRSTDAPSEEAPHSVPAREYRPERDQSETRSPYRDHFEKPVSTGFLEEAISPGTRDQVNRAEVADMPDRGSEK